MDQAQTPLGNTETMALPSGRSWTYRNKLIHAGRVAVEDELKKYLRADDAKIDESGRVTGQATIDFEHFSPTAPIDALIIAQTVDWSFGPIDIPTLGGLDEEDYGAMAEKAGEILNTTPLELLSASPLLKGFSRPVSPQENSVSQQS